MSNSQIPPTPPLWRHHPLSTNMTSSSTSTNLEVQSSLKINYFANLSSDSDELDDEFDPFLISYPSN
jgi:hypothetical protein